MPRKQVARRLGIGKIEPLRHEGVVRRQAGEARFLQADVVIGRETVDADDVVALPQEALRHMETDEPGCAGDQDGCWHEVARSPEKCGWRMIVLGKADRASEPAP